MVQKATAAPLFRDLAKGPVNGQAYFIFAKDGTRVRVVHWAQQDDKPVTGTVLLFPGRTEYIEKYAPVASELAARGLSTVAIDWRGQGLADRPDQERDIGHVRDFAEYQQDVASMMSLIDQLGLPKPLILLGHSMGGCIGLRALHEGLPVKGAIFTGPMWDIAFAPGLGVIAKCLARILYHSPWNMALAPSTSTQTYVLTQAFEGNLLTSNPTIYEQLVKQAQRRPELTLGGPSVSWLHAALSECARLAKLPAPQIPCVTFLGDQEQIVSSQAITELMDRWEQGSLEMVPGGQHEILMEDKAVRGRVYDTICDMIDA